MESADVNDSNHYFSKIADNYMGNAAKFTIKGGDGIYSLYISSTALLEVKQEFLNGLYNKTA